MRPVLTDRMATIGVLAGLIVWLCAITLLWGWAYDTSGGLTLRWLIIVTGVMTLGMWKRHKIARLAMRGVAGMKLRSKVPLKESFGGELGSSKADVQKRMSLFSTATVIAIGCFVFATLWIVVARFCDNIIGSYFLFGNWTWGAVENFFMLLGAVPVAAGMTCVLYATKIVRESSGRDIYAGCYRDWVWAIAIGFFAFGVSWWFGFNLVLLAFSIAGALLLMSFTAVSRIELATHPRKAMLPFGPPAPHTQWMIFALHAGATFVVLLQCRLLGDIFGLSMTRRAMWVFLSAGLTGYFLSRVDRKSKTLGVMQTTGATLGIIAALLAQIGELVMCISLESGVGLMVFFAVATQLPITSLAAELFSHQRRTFAVSGGTVGGFLLAVVGGVAAAFVMWWLLLSLPYGTIILILIAIAVYASASWLGWKNLRKSTHKTPWLVCCSLLVITFAAGLIDSMCTAGDVIGSQIDPGTWLSPKVTNNYDEKTHTQFGVLPINEVSRSNLLTRCLYDWTINDKDLRDETGVFSYRRGRWWVVAVDEADLPAEFPSRLYANGSNPQPPSVSKRLKHRRPPLSFSNADFFEYAKLNYVAQVGCDFYDGVFLAPLPADHPQAWRVYNQRVIRLAQRLTESLNPDGKVSHGLFVLRTQTGKDSVRRALSVARTYHRVVRSGWAVVAVRKSGLDMILLGPNDAIADSLDTAGNIKESEILDDLRNKIKNEPDIFLVPIEELWKAYPGVAEIQIFNPAGEMLDNSPRLEGLRHYLELTQQVLESNRKKKR